MPRSKWKGLFCDSLLARSVQQLYDSGGPRSQSLPIRVYSRASAILPEFVGYRFEIHNGKIFVPLDIKPNMVGHKFGEFALTRKFPTFPDKAVQRLTSEKKPKQPSH